VPRSRSYRRPPAVLLQRYSAAPYEYRTIFLFCGWSPVVSTHMQDSYAESCQKQALASNLLYLK
jgi:hypothetical protein